MPRRGRTLVRVDPRYFRPTEVETLLGDASKARAEARLDRRDRASRELVRGDGGEDLELAKRDALVAKEGYKIYSHHE